GRPAAVIGHHFGRPAHETKLIEIIRGRETSPQAIATSLTLAKRLGRVSVVIGHGIGSVANRILASAVHEACLLLDEGASEPQIDRAMTRFGMPAGSLGVLDTGGLDIRRGLANRAVTRREMTEAEIVDRVMTAMANEGARTIEEGCATRPGDIDIICCYGFGFPRARGGPMHYANNRR
ncbi:MAG: 3-hydroxyacyl-CoA dehydrogenase family protein, partial [Vicinamibacterales bacterium]